MFSFILLLSSTCVLIYTYAYSAHVWQTGFVLYNMYTYNMYNLKGFTSQQTIGENKMWGLFLQVRLIRETLLWRGTLKTEQNRQQEILPFTKVKEL